MASVEFTTEELASEEWRPVVGSEGIYSVSSLGRVRRDACGATAGKIFAGQLAASRKVSIYRAVTLSGKNRRQIRIHVLVAGAFLGPCPAGANVNHIDGVKMNNRVANLEYVTPAENNRHAARLGLYPSGEMHYSKLHPERVARGERNGSRTRPERMPRGERHVNAKLTNNEIRAIRAERAAGDQFRVIAARHGIGASTAYTICIGRAWAHVT